MNDRDLLHTALEQLANFSTLIAASSAKLREAVMAAEQLLEEVRAERTRFQAARALEDRAEIGRGAPTEFAKPSGALAMACTDAEPLSSETSIAVIHAAEESLARILVDVRGAVAAGDRDQAAFLDHTRRPITTAFAAIPSEHMSLARDLALVATHLALIERVIGMQEALDRQAAGRNGSAHGLTKEDP